MTCKICKFGGTSISNDDRCQYALNIVKKMSHTSKVVVVISAMGSNLKPIQAFQTEGNNTIEETSTNFELEMFEKFMESSYHLKIEDDFISSNGDRFLHAVFSIGFHYDIHFYLKRDEHIEELLNKALTA